jgi:hypothetical protein
MKLLVNLAERVESNVPPIVFKPKIPSDLLGFTSIPDLIHRVSDQNIQFPFQRELALYLLLVASLWPGNAERLLVGARIFSGALHFRLFGSGKNSKLVKKLNHASSSSEFDIFDRVFFSRIGGRESLLFCPSAEEFHREIWVRVNELAMVHDVIEYLIKTADLRELCSARMAFAAVAGNIFQRKNGYGVLSGSKRKRLPGHAATFETVRARWRVAPNTVVLSFVLARWCGAHYFDPVSPRFLPHLSKCLGAGSREWLINLLSIVQHRLRLGTAKQNQSILKRLLPETPRLQKALHFNPLTSSEFDRIVEIRKNSVHFKKDLTAAQETNLRSKCQTWWR